jgi:hypothetical protein
MRGVRPFAAVLTFTFAATGWGEAARPKHERKAVMQKISDETLRSCCSAPGNAVALVLVKSVEIDAPGTRSEHVTVDLAIERTICGAPPPMLEAWSFTSKGNSILTAGRRYVLALIAAQGYADFGLGEFVEVPQGRENEAVEMHQRALKALQKPAR